MTPEPNQTTTTLTSWWEDAVFNGKEFCTINAQGELSVLATPHYPSRTIATLTADNAEAIVRAMAEKFPEVEGKVKEIEEEWNASTDKLKLLGKVTRTREYLLHANAIGDFENLMQRVAAFEKELHELVEQNHAAKLALITQAEALAASENYKEASQQLRDITEQWKHIGYVEKERNEELWNRLEAARNAFFERKRQHQEDQEKEMLQNLDLKLELVEKAEQLAASDAWKEATEVFKQITEQWKNTGRTMPEKNEELWNRFIQAKNVFYDRKKVHFESIQTEQEGNYVKKLALVEKAEELKDSTEWNATSKAYVELMDQWKKIGKVPAEKSDELWHRFSTAKENFFSTKRHHFETVKVSLEDNYAQKQALLKRAEELKNSNLWRETTEELNELMTEWKKTGPVPREHSERIWEQFLAARAHFFNRKDADRERRKSRAEQQRNTRTSQTRQFLYKLEDELKEEEEKLVDFREGLENVTPGPKEHELRAHLQKLIAQTEQKIKNKETKIADVRKQLAELESRKGGGKQETAQAVGGSHSHDEADAEDAAEEAGEHDEEA